jgi:hypothetical protein
MRDALVGTWTLNTGASEFDPKYVPKAGTVAINLEPDGWYVVQAEGITAAGERVVERTQRFMPDEQERPDPEMAGVTTVARRTDANTIVVEGKRGGELLGRVSYAVSEDGNRLSATSSGVGVNGPFQTRVVFDRQVT